MSQDTEECEVEKITSGWKTMVSFQNYKADVKFSDS